MRKILTIVGARPQFIKASAIARALSLRDSAHQADPALHNVLVHTGQHYDANMAQTFFDELEIPPPDYNLGIGDLKHGAMTGRMLEALEPVLEKEQPHWVLVYGDTNSTLAGALTAAKLNIPVAHVEAGLRSFNLKMPEEINRVLTDRVSRLLFCPTDTAVENLKKEGIAEGVHNTGDVMQDVSLFYGEKARAQVDLSKWSVEEKGYVLATVHRAENTDDPNRLKNILTALNEMARDCPVILPLHPRTRERIDRFSLAKVTGDIQIVPPVGYLEMARLEMSARAILTDSGGVQKEAFFYRVPCLTLRDETEWVETVEMGWNRICGADSNLILEYWNGLDRVERRDGHPYGQDASKKIISLLAQT